MNFEAPVDSWYVWIGLVLASTAVAGVAVTVPSEPPPDASRVANAADEIAATSYDASASYEHDADAVKVGTQTIAMRNAAGTTRATITVGRMIPLAAVTNQTRVTRLRQLADGEDPETVLGHEPEVTLTTWIAAVQQRVKNGETGWVATDGSIHIQKITVGKSVVLLVRTDSRRPSRQNDSSSINTRR